jgi:hypothetical protein
VGGRAARAAGGFAVPCHVRPEMKESVHVSTTVMEVKNMQRVETVSFRYFDGTGEPVRGVGIVEAVFEGNVIPSLPVYKVSIVEISPEQECYFRGDEIFLSRENIMTGEETIHRAA